MHPPCLPLLRVQCSATVRGISYASFLLFDAIGALLWATTGVGTGFLFAREIPAIVGRIDDARTLLLYLGVGAVLLFLAIKWWVRRRHGKARLAIAEPEIPGSLS